MTSQPDTTRSPMPGQVYAFVDFNAEPPKDDEGNPKQYVMPDIVAPIDEANLITSAVAGSEYTPPFTNEEVRYRTHKLIIDLDVPAKLIPSSTPGHFHLYIDQEVGEWDYINLLNALAGAGIIETGYRNASVQRGYTAVRLPWIKKGDSN